jgi:hypothetical protein
MTDRDQAMVVTKNETLYGSIFREREKRDAFIEQVRAAHPHQRPDTKPAAPPSKEAPAGPALPPDASADKPGDWPLK